MTNNKSFYNSNEDFKRYVDRCAFTYQKSVDEVLESPITKAYKQSLEKGGCNSKIKGKEEQNEYE